MARWDSWMKNALELDLLFSFFLFNAVNRLCSPAFSTLQEHPLKLSTQKKPAMKPRSILIINYFCILAASQSEYLKQNENIYFYVAMNLLALFWPEAS